MLFSRQLTEELSSTKKLSQQNDQELRGEVDRLRRDNERQQQLISSVISGEAGSGEEKLLPGASEVLLQGEIMRLTAENLVSPV